MTPNPGVYKMLDANNNVIYVGKAKNLKKRVSSYFQQKNHSTRIKRMISLIKKIDLTITKTEADAFLLENIPHLLMVCFSLIECKKFSKTCYFSLKI